MQDDQHRMMIVEPGPRHGKEFECLLIGVGLGATSVMIYVAGWRLLVIAYTLAFP